MNAVNLSALISFFLLLNAMANFFFLRRTHYILSEVETVVSVLIPMRDEAANVHALIECMKSQIGLKAAHFFLINDNSTDDTLELAASCINGDARFTLLQAPPLTSGWLGKPATMQYGIEESTSELVVFIDADVRLSNDAIARAVTTLQDLNLNFISAYPMQVAKTWSEKLIQPLLQWSWMSSVPLRISEKSKNPALCVANGQFFVVERQALRKIEDLYRIRSAVLDDIFLARELVRSGFHGTVIDGSKIASCRMYSSWSELREGYGKSLHTAFGSIFGTAIAISLFLLTGVLPLASAFFGSKIGLAAFFAITATRALSAITSRGKMWHCILHPFSMLLLIYLLIRSWVKRNHVLWKGRPV